MQLPPLLNKLWSYVSSTDYPRKPYGFYVSNTRKGILMCCLILGMFYHCPVLFSRSTDFSSPLQLLANFGVRVYVFIVAGGSLIMYILSQYNDSVANIFCDLLAYAPIPPHAQRSGMGSLGESR